MTNTLVVSFEDFNIACALVVGEALKPPKTDPGPRNSYTKNHQQTLDRSSTPQ